MLVNIGKSTPAVIVPPGTPISRRKSNKKIDTKALTVSKSISQRDLRKSYDISKSKDSPIKTKAFQLTKDKRSFYSKTFREHNYEGFILGSTAKELFSGSGLDQKKLAKIWSLADREKRGKLNKQEFFMALVLIDGVLNGEEVPSELPTSLVRSALKTSSVYA